MKIPHPGTAVILSGMKHCGKSSTGRLLAARTGLAFFDLDDFIRKVYDPAGGTSVREIYRRNGAEYFQKIEAEAAERITEEGGGKPVVIALGGGTVENPAALELIKKNGILLYLEEKPEILYKRIFGSGLPPFLQTGNPYQTFLELYQKRTALYKEYADYTINVTGKTPLAVSDEIRTEILPGRSGGK